MNKKHLLLSLFILSGSITSCDASFEECIEEINEESLNEFISYQKKNCMIFFYNSSLDSYSDINTYANRYYKNNSKYKFYKVDATKIKDSNYYISKINNESITSLDNTLALFEYGEVYRASNSLVFKGFTSSKDNYFKSFVMGTNEFTSKVNVEANKDYKEIISLTASEVNEKIASNDSFLIMYGSSTCSSCKECVPTLNSFVSSTNYPIYYSYEYSKVSKLKIEFTPTLVTYANGKLTNYHIGCYSNNELKDIFNK